MTETAHRTLRYLVVFGAAALITASGATAQEPRVISPSQESRSSPESRSTRTFTMGMRNASFDELLKIIAESTGRTLIVDSRVSRSLTVTYGPRELTLDELWQAFEQIVESLDLELVEDADEGVWRVVPAREAPAPPRE